MTDGYVVVDVKTGIAVVELDDLKEAVEMKNELNDELRRSGRFCYHRYAVITKADFER